MLLGKGSLMRHGERVKGLGAREMAITLLVLSAVGAFIIWGFLTEPSFTLGMVATIVGIVLLWYVYKRGWRDGYDWARSEEQRISEEDDAVVRAGMEKDRARHHR